MIDCELYSVTCEAGKFSNRWVVRRLSDGRVMTEGSVTHCLRWVDVWGPMHRVGKL